MDSCACTIPRLTRVTFSNSRFQVDSIDEDLLRRVVLVSAGQLAPMCAFFGGVVAQEAMKAVSGSFSPFRQWVIEFMLFLFVFDLVSVYSVTCNFQNLTSAKKDHNNLIFLVLSGGSQVSSWRNQNAVSIHSLLVTLMRSPSQCHF